MAAGPFLSMGDKPVLPMMDYEAVCPPAIDQAYARIAPPYDEVFCRIGAGAMKPAKQLLWQQSAYPVEFDAPRPLPPRNSSPCGSADVLQVKISQLSAQGHIWDLVRHQPSSVMRERGWYDLLPQRVPAGAVLGDGFGSRSQADRLGAIDRNPGADDFERQPIPLQGRRHERRLDPVDRHLDNPAFSATSLRTSSTLQGR